MAGAGLGVGFLVGLTGMGGGAVMTPLLILVFGVPPLAAVSSDLVTSLLMKPVGAVVHLRGRTVDWAVVRWLAAGAVPAAFAGVLVVRQVAHGRMLQADLRVLIGAVLLCSVVASLVAGMARRDVAQLSHRRRAGPALVIGAVAGLSVGMTSVGAGSLVITLLLLAYPGMPASRLVGTDLVQAVPLVAAATAGHLLFGEVHLAVTLSLALGAGPGVDLGARLSARARTGALKPVIVAVLLASGLALLGVQPAVLLAVTGGFLVLRLAAAVAPRLQARRAVAADVAHAARPEPAG